VGCSPQADQGCVFLSFSADASGDSVLFELSGPAEGYVAFALSLDKWMVSDPPLSPLPEQWQTNASPRPLEPKVESHLSDLLAFSDKLR